MDEIIGVKAIVVMEVFVGNMQNWLTLVVNRMFE